MTKVPDGMMEAKVTIGYKGFKEAIIWVYEDFPSYMPENKTRFVREVSARMLTRQYGEKINPLDVLVFDVKWGKDLEK